MKAGKQAWIFLLFLLVNVLVHLPFLKYPPCGAHVWRQCNTMAMARNFAEESMDISKPRIDRRNETNGITGSHFPLYEWGLGGIWKLTGFSEPLVRCYSLFIFTLSMFGFYLLLLRLGLQHTSAAAGGLLLLSLPQFYYDSINAMPDILALMLSMYGCLFFIRYYRENRYGLLTLALGFTILGGLIKPQFLLAPFATIVFSNINRKTILSSLAAWILVLACVYAWYQYALALTRAQNLKEFGLWIEPISTQAKLQTIFVNLTSDLPELLTGWPLFIALLVFTALNIRRFRISRNSLFVLAWLAGFAVFYSVAIERMQHHSYYFMSVLPAAIVILLQCLKTYAKLPLILATVLSLNMGWAGIRIIPSRWTSNSMGIQAEFMNKEQRQKLANSVPEGARIIIGPDVSGCIYFYFTHTKGFAFSHPEELLQPKPGGNYMNMMRTLGATHLICQQSPAMDNVLTQIPHKTLKNQVGNFQVWELMPQSTL